MEEMDDDEVIALVVSAVGAGVGVFDWYGKALGITTIGASIWSRIVPLVLPAPLTLALFRVLVTAAARDVRVDFRYQLLFTLMGLAAMLLVVPRAMAFIGVSYRDDVLERRNPAAAFAVFGAVTASAIVFAGGNIGEGPSIWNTVATTLAAGGLMAFAVSVLAETTPVTDTLAIERDVAAGVRFAGWIVAMGLVFAYASAGDWAGTKAMLRDLVRGSWPAAILVVVAIAAERTLQPTLARPQPSVLVWGVIPALGYLGFAVAYVAASSRLVG